MSRKSAWGDANNTMTGASANSTTPSTCQDIKNPTMDAQPNSNSEAKHRSTTTYRAKAQSQGSGGGEALQVNTNIAFQRSASTACNTASRNSFSLECQRETTTNESNNDIKKSNSLNSNSEASFRRKSRNSLTDRRRSRNSVTGKTPGDDRRSSKQLLSNWAMSIQGKKKLSIPEVVLMAIEREHRKRTAAAICCPCYMVMDKEKRVKGTRIMNHPINNIVSVVCTLFCLFGDDVVVFLTEPSADPILQSLFLVCFFYFILDLVLRSSLNRRYVYTFMWWLDCAAIGSLIPDIPMLSNWLVRLLGLDNQVVSTEDQISLARAGRAARAGTRAGRIMKLMRLVRLVRMLKLFQLFRRKRINMEVPESQQEVSHVGVKISALIEFKVIFGVMVMILILPMLQYEESCDSMITNQLLSLEIASIAMGSLCDVFFQQLAHGTIGDSATFTSNGCQNQFQHFLSQHESDLLFLEVAGVEWFNNTKVIGQLVRHTHIWTIQLDDELRAQEYNETIMNQNVPFPSTTLVFDRTEQQQKEALLSFLQTQVVIILLGVQAHLLNKDVDRLLVKPLREMNAYVKPFMKKAMIEWAQTTMVDRKKPPVPTTPLARVKSFIKKKEKDDKESISTAIMMATIRSMKNHMSENTKEEWAKKEGKRKLWQSVRVMLHNKERMGEVFDELENIAEEESESNNTTEHQNGSTRSLNVKTTSSKVHPSS